MKDRKDKPAVIILVQQFAVAVLFIVGIYFTWFNGLDLFQQVTENDSMLLQMTSMGTKASMIYSGIYMLLFFVLSVIIIRSVLIKEFRIAFIMGLLVLIVLGLEVFTDSLFRVQVD